ncbi:amino acid permease [Candidatus Woesearchaeota archaeon]|nr:amino acid permease [Candidatus Woesearchaeota archaeon]
MLRQSDGIAKYKLKRGIGLFEATLYGIGIILGAGIYALIGVGAGIAGNALWLSFLIGAAIAAFTGFSYAELSSMYPKEAAEYVYTKHAFRKNSLAFIVQWVMLFTGIVSVTAVALGFAGYWSFLFGGQIALIAFLLIAVMSLINYFGISESAKYNDISTIIETCGLLAIIGLGIYYITRYDIFASVNFLSSPTGITGILTATTVVYFAFIGFENLVNISEEAKNARKVIPKALLISLAISALIYVLVSVAAVAILGADALSHSKAPLAEVAEKIVPGGSYVLSLIALFATSNTVLILLIVSSRLLYGLASNKMLPALFAHVGTRGTPFISVITVGIFAALGLLLGSIKSLAHLVDLGIFVVYIFVNLSVIILRYREPGMKRAFKAPLNIGRFPMLAFLGLAANLGLLYYFDLRTFISGILLSLAGFVIYLILCKKAAKGAELKVHNHKARFHRNIVLKNKL